MTRERFYGEGDPFGSWVRAQDDLDSIKKGLTVNDIDWCFHKYKMNIDGFGSRQVRCTQLVEVKTRGAPPTRDQIETFFFLHQKTYDKRKSLVVAGTNKKCSVWDFGCNFLRMNGTRPDDGLPMYWGVFNKDGTIRWYAIQSENGLKGILRFDFRPDDPTKELSIRRHHKTNKAIVKERLSIFNYCGITGEETDRIIITRS